MALERIRCGWCTQDPLYLRYHDEEWGVPVHDDRQLFEMLILEGAQAGLSWLTILKRREGYRRAFANFEADQVARFDDRRIEQLCQDPGIIRHRLKIAATVTNARAFLRVQQEFGTFDRYIWSFVGGQTLPLRRLTLTDIPSRSTESEAMSKDLKKRGFGFVGPTVCYAFMQAVGMVNDHTSSCFRAQF